MSYQLIAGELCLDFINTLDNRPRLELALELLNSYDDLLRWAGEAGVMPQVLVRSLRVQAQAEPARATAVLKDAIALRECLYRIFTHVARGKRPSPADLAALDRACAAAATHLHLEPNRQGFRLGWHNNPPRLDAPLWRVARSASDLLTSADLSFVRECEDETCRWLFVDRSRNHSRRWCDMKVCGNRIKARAFYRRQHKRSQVGLSI